MKFKDRRTSQILVGLHRIGLADFKDALRKAEASGVEGMEAVVDFVIDALVGANYIPDRESDDLRTAIWREYLRARGEDFSQFLSTMDVGIRGEDGPERRRFEEMLTSILAEFELRPVITRSAAPSGEPAPQLVIHGEVVISGMPGREKFKQAVRKRVSHW